MTKLNMKIEINKTQPTHIVLRELERLGYMLGYRTSLKERLIIAFDYGVFGVYSNTNRTDTCEHPLVTLCELKEMK